MTIDIQSPGFGAWHIVNYSTTVTIIVVIPGIKKQRGHVFKAVVNSLFLPTLAFYLIHE